MSNSPTLSPPAGPASPPGVTLREVTSAGLPVPGTFEGLAEVASRLAVLLRGEGEVVARMGADGLVAEDNVAVRALARSQPPPQVWAVDGGQALVADARCLSVHATRAARVCFADGGCRVQDLGTLAVRLLGGGEDSRVALALGLDPATAVDANLLRDHAEWEAVATCVEEAEPGSMVLIDGDLQADWRVAPAVLAIRAQRAAALGVTLVGVVKRSALARRGAPLIGQLETEAEELLGPRARWWVPVARSIEGAPFARRVVVARLDPDSRYAFRIDLPMADDDRCEGWLGQLSAVCDDAAFPGYPYPLTVADRLAACPTWVRADAGWELDNLLAAAGVPLATRDRAFADRHALMERS
ncbi:MAG: DNA double-strand break repair nuclease NurA [Acidimicrobiales bacterium]